MLTADLHLHSLYSKDSCNGIEWMIRRCRKVGVNCVACTDHNTTQGAFELMRKAPFRVIVGEEIDTGQGEIIGLFLKKEIIPNLGIMKTVSEIKTQQGLVYLPHPTSSSRKSQLCVDELMRVQELVDIVETFNPRTLKERTDRNWLESLLSSGRIVKGAGSDSHSPYEIGNVLISMDDFSSPEGFLKSLSKASFSCKRNPYWMRVLMNRKTRAILRKALWKMPY